MKTPEIIVYIATTLDGKIARSDGSIDWLEHDSLGSDYGWDSFRGGIDGLILGRKTFETVLNMEIPWPYAGLQALIWSQSLKSDQLPAELHAQGVAIHSGPPSDAVKELSDRGCKQVWVDGGETIRQFLDAGVVDRVILTVFPIVLGSGVPLFEGLARDHRLKFVSAESFPSGIVQLTYKGRME